MKVSICFCSTAPVIEVLGLCKLPILWLSFSNEIPRDEWDRDTLELFEL
jgi:hypothetical protein